MKAEIIFKELNPEYDQEYADIYHDGKESENNWKAIWAESFGIDGSLEDHNVINSGTYQLKGEFIGKGEFCFEIPDMCILECKTEDDIITRFAVSNSMLDKTYHSESKDRNKFYFYFYLKNDKEAISPKDGIFIDIKDYPQELIDFEKEMANKSIAKDRD